MRERELLKAVAEYTVAEGVGKEAARERVAKILAELDPEKARKRGLEDVARQVLMELGMPFNLKGNERLVCALAMAAQEPSVVSAITKNLYPEVAKRFAETTSMTERNIRSAIERTFERGRADALEHYFGNAVDWENGKLANKAFITRVAGIVRRRAGMEEGYGL